MTTVREIIKRDIGVKVEGVVKVFDRSALADEVREYVVTDKIEDELKRIVDTFTQVSETLRRGGASRDVVGMWVSGFFGSGKSHFAKVLGYLLQNDELDGRDGERCIDAFVKHLSDSQRGKDVRLRLGEIKLEHADPHDRLRDQEPPIADQPQLGGGDPAVRVLPRYRPRPRTSSLRGSSAACSSEASSKSSRKIFEAVHGVPWRSAEGRDDLMTVRRRLAEGPAEDRPRGVPRRAVCAAGTHRHVPSREDHG